ncbi:MAG: peroxiredoxin family protein, partial [Lysobacterales bacterium]
MNQVSTTSHATRHSGKQVKRVKRVKGLLVALAWLPAAALVSGVWAQTPAPAAPAAVASAAARPVTTPVIEGKTIDGSDFKLSSLKGKVVLVMFWSTGCAVCRDKMPELRQNYEGWRGKPFEMVLVST